MNIGKTFARIEKLFDVGLLKDVRVLIAGCGSGGSNIALQLVMSGIQNFSLIDSDILEPENIIRHACGRRYIGYKKVDALEDLLKDRNPSIDVRKFDVDITKFGDFEQEVKKATTVILATDNDHSRYYVNEVCVRNKIPFVSGRVFTRGIGGEVFSYRPNSGGCMACLESLLQRTKFRQNVREVDLVSEEEREKMYGMEIAEIKDSPGLNIDISFITAFHTRYALDALASCLPKRPKYMLPIEHNYIVWGNRPVKPFTKHFHLQRINLPPLERCQVCSTGKK